MNLRRGWVQRRQEQHRREEGDEKVRERAKRDSRRQRSTPISSKMKRLVRLGEIDAARAPDDIARAHGVGERARVERCRANDGVAHELGALRQPPTRARERGVDSSSWTRGWNRFVVYVIRVTEPRVSPVVSLRALRRARALDRTRRRRVDFLLEDAVSLVARVVAVRARRASPRESGGAQTNLEIHVYVPVARARDVVERRARGVLQEDAHVSQDERARGARERRGRLVARGDDLERCRELHEDRREAREPREGETARHGARGREARCADETGGTSLHLSFLHPSRRNTRKLLCVCYIVTPDTSGRRALDTPLPAR